MTKRDLFKQKPRTPWYILIPPWVWVTCFVGVVFLGLCLFCQSDVRALHEIGVI
jgi:hypothetical protein